MRMRRLSYVNSRFRWNYSAVSSSVTRLSVQSQAALVLMDSRLLIRNQRKRIRCIPLSSFLLLSLSLSFPFSLFVAVPKQRRQIPRVKPGIRETSGTLFFPPPPPPPFFFAKQVNIRAVDRIDKTRRRFRVAPSRTRLLSRCGRSLVRRPADIIICEEPQSRRFAIRTGTMGPPPRWPTMSNVVRASHVRTERAGVPMRSTTTTRGCNRMRQP